MSSKSNDSTPRAPIPRKLGAFVASSLLQIDDVLESPSKWESESKPSALFTDHRPSAQAKSEKSKPAKPSMSEAAAASPKPLARPSLVTSVTAKPLAAERPRRIVASSMLQLDPSAPVASAAERPRASLASAKIKHSVLLGPAKVVRREDEVRPPASALPLKRSPAQAGSVATLKKSVSRQSRDEDDFMPVFTAGKRFSDLFIQHVIELHLEIKTKGLKAAFTALLQRRDKVYWSDHILPKTAEQPTDIFCLFGNDFQRVKWSDITKPKGSFISAEFEDLLIAVVLAMVDEENNVPVLRAKSTQHVGLKTVDGQSCMVTSVEFYNAAVGLATDTRRNVLPLEVQNLEDEIIVPFQLSSTLPRTKNSSQLDSDGNSFAHFAYMNIDLKNAKIRIKDSLCSRTLTDSHKCAANLVGEELNNYLQNDRKYEVICERCPRQINSNCGFHVALNIGNRLMGISNTTEDCEQMRKVAPLMMIALGFESPEIQELLF